MFLICLQVEIDDKCAVLRITYKKPSDLMIQNGDKGITFYGIGKINSCENEIEIFDPSNPEADPEMVFQ